MLVFILLIALRIVEMLSSYCGAYVRTAGSSTGGFLDFEISEGDFSDNAAELVCSIILVATIGIVNPFFVVGLCFSAGDCLSTLEEVDV
jgi:hypothetical protein